MDFRPDKNEVITSDAAIVARLAALMLEGDKGANGAAIKGLTSAAVLTKYDQVFAAAGFSRREACPAGSDRIVWDRRDKYYFGECSKPGDRYDWYISLNYEGFVIGQHYSGWGGPGGNNILYHGIIPPDGVFFSQLLPLLYGSAELFGPVGYAPQAPELAAAAG